MSALLTLFLGLVCGSILGATLVVMWEDGE